MSAVVVQNLEKSYGKTNAVNGISFNVDEGELFGIIGPDGAGKTTIFRVLTTLIKPDSGEATLLGKDVVSDYREIRAMVGYMPGRFSLYQDLSVQENLEFFASVFGTTIDENYQLIKPIFHQLEPFKDRLAGDLSGGMKQKLALSCALIHKPKILFLDEPTTGVDAVSRQEFWQMLHRLKEEGISIVVSTPYMDEAEQCDRVALLQKGKILSIDKPGDITREFEANLWAIKAENKYRLINALRNYEFAETVHPFGEFLHYTDSRNRLDFDELKKFLQEQGIQNSEIRKVDPGIEDTFIRLMEREGTHG